MFKKLILICICLILLVSCGRKNDPKYEASSNGNVMIFKESNNILHISNQDEI